MKTMLLLVFYLINYKIKSNIYILINLNSLTVKISAIFGLGLAYAGSQNDDLRDPLDKVLEDFSFGFEVSAFISLTYGLTFLGSGDEGIFGNLMSVIIII
jgi:26S proteasome regulatory subunit N1